MHEEVTSKSASPTQQRSEEFKDYYQILNIDKSASGSEIRRAFFTLKNTYSDSNQALYSLVNGSELNSTLVDIERAYDLLINVNSRLQYDRELVARNMARPDQLFPYIKEMLRAEANRATQAESKVRGGVSAELPISLEEFAQVEQLLEYDRPKPAPIQRGTVIMVTPKINAPGVRERVEAMLESVKGTTIDGPFLVKLREVVSVGIEELQEHTKISRGNLESLEKNYFDRLPQLVYVKGFLKSYFRFLGIVDYDDVVQSYLERLQEWGTEKKS